MVKKGLVAVQRGLILTGSKQKIGLQAAWTKIVIADELADRDSHALGDEGERRHRRLGAPELEGATVRGGISALASSAWVMLEGAAASMARRVSGLSINFIGTDCCQITSSS
jgi:hypothetical protein